MTTTDQFHLRRRAYVLERFAIGDSNLRLQIEDGLMPPPVSIGPRAVAWILHELDAVLAAIVAGKSAEFIRALIRRFVDLRKDAGEELGA